MQQLYSDQQINEFETSQYATFLKIIESWEDEDIDYGLIFDFDDTISRIRGDGLDPRDSYLDEKIYRAFAAFLRVQKNIVLLSSRGGKDLVRIVEEAQKQSGIVHPPDALKIVFIGSLGWETLDHQEHSHINERFL